ncbi:hypothetical protein mO231L [Vaccinia virus]|uniref:Uncharacterized protein n=1 Tax=Vaccinia virus (strain LC16m0) TaxID=10246 RepID=Q49PC6_VACC0|nr:hypothetical protein mO231L [Vaccinia virus]BBD06265.1 putative A54L [BAC cloning vector pLC16m8.8S-BAC]
MPRWWRSRYICRSQCSNVKNSTYSQQILYIHLLILSYTTITKSFFKTLNHHQKSMFKVIRLKYIFEINSCISHPSILDLYVLKNTILLIL